MVNKDIGVFKITMASFLYGVSFTCLIMMVMLIHFIFIFVSREVAISPMYFLGFIFLSVVCYFLGYFFCSLAYGILFPSRNYNNDFKNFNIAVIGVVLFTLLLDVFKESLKLFTF